MVVLHTSSQDDVLLCLQRGELCPNQDRVGELVGSLVDHFSRSVLHPTCSFQAEPIRSDPGASFAVRHPAIKEKLLRLMLTLDQPLEMFFQNVVKSPDRTDTTW